ncbi:protein of unknown function [Vibrio tapetis subsp. tapetis]|uniref:Uncharacterized protein n=1 Tax=Vibrio tapetis subsp. tapetis TaxID=1671868 RepID=A0A2N8ZCR7_9VIBR|nr:protein of unknown function [Vibrio tapetis subsp. tapetis]
MERIKKGPKGPFLDFDKQFNYMNVFYVSKKRAALTNSL